MALSGCPALLLFCPSRVTLQEFLPSLGASASQLGLLPSWDAAALRFCAIPSRQEVFPSPFHSPSRPELALLLATILFCGIPCIQGVFPSRFHSLCLHWVRYLLLLPGIFQFEPGCVLDVLGECCLITAMTSSAVWSRFSWG